jgi:CelD/BcsL family acetyltransferase involved in cellulose biosynthesis
MPLVSDPGILFENVLSPKRRRKLRAIDRRFDQLGFECHHATSSLDIETTLRTYLEQKASWFLANGIENPFHQPGIVAFLTELAMNPFSGCEIYSLRMKSGYIAAVACMLVASGRASLMFMSHDPSSPVARLSPGSKLVREIISNACRRRLAEFDFGLGEAAHKAALGGKPEATYCLFRPQSSRGRVAAALFEGERRAKIAAKSHPFVTSEILRFKGIAGRVLRPGAPDRSVPAADT